MIVVPLTPEQSALLQQAVHDAQHAQDRLRVIATALSAGRAPAGSELVNVNAQSATFRPPAEGPRAA